MLKNYSVSHFQHWLSSLTGPSRLWNWGFHNQRFKPVLTSVGLPFRQTSPSFNDGQLFISAEQTRTFLHRRPLSWWTRSLLRHFLLIKVTKNTKMKVKQHSGTDGKLFDLPKSTGDENRSVRQSCCNKVSLSPSSAGVCVCSMKKAECCNVAIKRAGKQD